MFKTEITYKDFLGNDVTKTLRFNISEDELLDLVNTDSRFESGYLAFAMQDQNYAKMMDVIRKLIVMSYGELSDDGEYFRKSDEKAIDFLQSAAYEAFRDSLISDQDNKFVDFLLGVFPAKFAKVIKEKIDSGETKQISVVK